jgi:hypothetical protein
MQKVVGSSPIIRFIITESPAQGLFCFRALNARLRAGAGKPHG